MKHHLIQRKHYTCCTDYDHGHRAELHRSEIPCAATAGSPREPPSAAWTWCGCGRGSLVAACRRTGTLTKPQVTWPNHNADITPQWTTAGRSAWRGTPDGPEWEQAGRWQSLGMLPIRQTRWRSAIGANRSHGRSTPHAGAWRRCPCSIEGRVQASWPSLGFTYELVVGDTLIVKPPMDRSSLLALDVDDSYTNGLAVITHLLRDLKVLDAILSRATIACQSTVLSAAPLSTPRRRPTSPTPT
jgi:hypothetical protein